MSIKYTKFKKKNILLKRQPKNTTQNIIKKYHSKIPTQKQLWGLSGPTISVGGIRQIVTRAAKEFNCHGFSFDTPAVVLWNSFGTQLLLLWYSSGSPLVLLLGLFLRVLVTPWISFWPLHLNSVFT